MAFDTIGDLLPLFGEGQLGPRSVPPTTVHGLDVVPTDRAAVEYTPASPFPLARYFHVDAPEVEAEGTDTVTVVIGPVNGPAPSSYVGWSWFPGDPA